MISRVKNCNGDTYPDALNLQTKLLNFTYFLRHLAWHCLLHLLTINLVEKNLDSTGYFYPQTNPKY